MSCIITYKGNKYSEEEFKQSFSNNQKEFEKNISSNKDIIDSFKRKMEGINFVFNQSPELEQIGTKSQYLQYLSTIFKTSKVKDIVYHGSPSKIEIFDKSKLGINTGSESAKNAFFFASNPFTSFIYTWKSWDMGQDEYSGDMIYTAIHQIGKFAERFDENTSLKELLLDKEIQSISSNNIYLQILESLKKFDALNKTQSIFFPISENQSVKFEKDYSNKSKGVFTITTEGIGEENFFGIKEQEDVISEKEFDNFIKKGIEYLKSIKPDIKIYQVVLNSQNPLIVDDENQGFRQETYSDRVNNAKKENNDSVIINNTADPLPNSNIFAVFEPEQIHILGGKQDIEGFKNFVKESSKPKVPQITDEYGNTWNEVTLEETRDTSTIFMKQKTFEEKMQELVDPNAENILHLNEVEEIQNEELKEYGDVNNEILFNNTKKQMYTADEILQNILNNNLTELSEHGRFFLEKAAKVLAKTNATVRIRSEKWMRLNGSKDVIMSFDPQSNTINISLEILNDITPELAVEAFIHEVVHSATIKAYVDPKTFEERSFKAFIDKAYEKYKGLSELKNPNTGKIYGFKNAAEFITEAYTNPEFQNILRGLDPEVTIEKGFWSELINMIRRLFGLTKSVENNGVIDFISVNRVIDQMVEQGNPNWKGTIINDLRYGIFEKQAKKETYLKYDHLETIQEKLQYRVDQIKDNIDQNLGKYEKIKSSIKKDDPRRKKLSNYADILKNLQTELNSYDDNQNWLAVNTYVKNLVTGIDILDSRFSKEDFSNKNIIGTIKLYSQYLDSYSLIEDIMGLVSDSRAEEDVSITEEERMEIKEALQSAKGKYDSLRKDFHAFLKKGIKKDLSNIKNVPEVETRWKKRLTQEYNENKESLGITESKTEWISKQMNTVHKEEIQKDVEKEVNKIIEGIGYDIQAGSYYFSSALNTNSSLVQMFQFILDEIRAKITDMVTSKDVQFDKLFNKLVKEKGSTDVLKLYKNIVEYDGDTPLLKGEYSIQYKLQYEKLTEQLDVLSETKGKTSTEYQNTLKKRTDLNKKDFKNDFSKLSKTELEVLNFFKELIDETSKMTYNIQSLKKFEKGVTYYKLPVVTKSDLERILQGDGIGIVKDKWKDLTEIRPDEEGFEYANTENIDMAGNPLYNIRILYRGNIPGKDQSLDLFTIMRLEYLNAVNFQVKSEKEIELNSIVEIAKNKSYYRTSGIRNRTLSRFSTRNKTSTVEGSESNTYKKLKSMMEMNIYNMMAHNAGKLGPADMNKVIGFLNKWLAHAGLDLNRHAATANVLNAQANMFLESIGKQVIKGRDLKRANMLYGNDLGNILKDVNNPIPKSFTNQALVMFDTFGYRDIGANAFIRKGVAKSLINTDRGQIMHTSGEHWVQSTLTLAVLNSVKVMNENSQFINKQGEVVDEKLAASVLDMLELNADTGRIQMNPKAVYTTHTLNVKFNQGGREQIAELVKKKVLDSFGNYDPNMQPEIMRHWWGKMIMIFRRFFVPMLTQRYKGFEFSLKSRVELEKEPEKYLSYSHSLKEYEEGTYTTLVRFITHSLIPSIKQRSFKTLSSDYKNLSDFEKGNMRKAMTEIALTSFVLPLIRMILTALLGGAGDDPKDKMIYFWLYQTRRLESELAQFRNINEQFKILRSPIPSARLLEQSSTLLYKLINPFEWENLNDKYETGRKKGDLKIRHDIQKLIPVLNKIEINSKELFEYQDAAFGR